MQDTTETRCSFLVISLSCPPLSVIDTATTFHGSLPPRHQLSRFRAYEERHISGTSMPQYLNVIGQHRPPYQPSQVWQVLGSPSQRVPGDFGPQTARADSMPSFDNGLGIHHSPCLKRPYQPTCTDNQIALPQPASLPYAPARAKTYGEGSPARCCR